MSKRRLPSPGASVAAALALSRSGLVRLYRPDHLLGIGSGLLRYRFGPAWGPRFGASVYPDAVAIVDDFGTATFRQLDDCCDAVACGLVDSGLSAGDAVGLLARNSTGFYQTMVAAARCGLDVVYLNTGFTAEQIAQVVTGEAACAVVFDEEFAGRVPNSLVRIPMTGPHPGAPRSIAAMRASASRAQGAGPYHSRHVILSSGTTGQAKGTARTGGHVASVVSLLSGLPYRVRETHLVAAPMFHAWGWLNTLLTMLLSSTLVLNRRFDPEGTLSTIEREGCQVLVAVPVMLQRIMNLPAGVRRRYDTSSLRVVAVSGSSLSAVLARSFMDEFGEILYSLYGSTEAAFATVAGPAELGRAAATAGRPLPNVQVLVVDDQGHTCPPGRPGAILVRGPDSVGGTPVRTGDLGWFDERGNLFVGAREDEMVVTGGENVYPVVVEHALEQHPDVVEAAVVGVPDPVYGQVLVGHVVMRTDSSATPEGLLSWCRHRLAPFQVPRRIVLADSLPRNDAGKVVKRRLGTC